MAALCAMLMAACWYDYREKRIPNLLIMAVFVFGVGWRLWREGITGSLFYLGQAIVVIIPMYFLFQVGVIGAGDVKLFGVTAGYLPFEKIFYFLFVSLLIAAIISLIKLLKNKNLAERLEIFMKYSADVWKSRSLKLYPAECASDSYRGICLSGPILLSLLLYLGGVY